MIESIFGIWVFEVSPLARNCSIAYTAALDTFRGLHKVLLAQVEPLRDEDPDAVHDMRVASRRLRAALSEYGRVFEKDRVKRLRAMVRQLTQDLSSARELDVSIALLAQLRDELDGPCRLSANYVLRRLGLLRRTENEKTSRCAECVASPEFNQAFQAVVHSFGRRKQCQVANAKKRVKRRFRDVRDAYARWVATSSADDLHRLRIAFKKLRYTCELYQKTYGGDMAEFIMRLKQVQDWLGDWHDYFVIERFVAACESQAPPKSSAGIAGLRQLLDAESAPLLAEFTQGALAFFEPAAVQNASDVFESLRHECCWSDSRNGEACERK